MYLRGAGRRRGSARQRVLGGVRGAAARGLEWRRWCLRVADVGLDDEQDEEDDGEDTLDDRDHFRRPEDHDDQQPDVREDRVAGRRQEDRLRWAHARVEEEASEEAKNYRLKNVITESSKTFMMKIMLMKNFKTRRMPFTKGVP